LTSIAVNCESARNGGTRNHLRAVLAAASDATFTPIFRTSDGRSFTLSEPPLDGVDAALPLLQRLMWERRTLPVALDRLRPSVLLQPSNVGLPRQGGLPRVQILHNVAPITRPLSSVSSGRLRVRLEILERLTMRAMRSANGVIFLSQHAADLLAEHGWRGNGRVLRPGLSTLQPRAHDARDPVVVVVAHLFRFKHVEDAVNGFARSGLAAGGVRLRIYGGHYDKAYVREVRQAIASSGIAESVELTGSRPVAEVQGAISGALAVIQPSICENAPQIVYECIAASTPIVASSIAAHRELLRSGLYPPGEPDGLAAALLEAVDGRAVNEVAVPLGSWTEHAEAIARFCTSVASDRS
jgi:glycosyltransferase involved in cell wall biosynthesis